MLVSSAAQRARSGGFTLIELMIAVCIIGVLASVAIPAYSRFLIQVRGAEGYEHIGAMYKGAAAYWEREFAGRTLGQTGVGVGSHCMIAEPSDDGGITTVPPIPPVPYARSANLFEHRSWQAMGYNVSAPIYFCLGWNANFNDGGGSEHQCGGMGEGQLVYSLMAGSDLDDDGLMGGLVLNVFERNGQLTKAAGYQDVAALFEDMGGECPACAVGID